MKVSCIILLILLTRTASYQHFNKTLIKDRIQGAILGVFIGDALGVGVHWQYDLDQLEADRGFVTDYLDPIPGSYHSGTDDSPGGRGKPLKAGQLEQQGAIDQLLLESLAAKLELDQEDFLERFEHEILRDPAMDGTRQGGSHGWTDKSICDIWKCRIAQNGSWSECASPRSDTPDAIVRAALIATLYYQTPMEMAVAIRRHAQSATLDSSVQAHAVAFGSMVAATLQGVPLTYEMKDFLYQQAGRALPYSSLLSVQDYNPEYGEYSEPDTLLWFGSIAKGVKEFETSIQPAHRGILLYGQFCAHFATLPSAYYCTARFPNNFEDAVLCSVNGGGQTTMRTSLVGALLGARVGLSGIPSRFLKGLEHSDYLISLAETIADAAWNKNNTSDKWFWPTEMDMDFTIGSASHSHPLHGVPVTKHVDSSSGVAQVISSASHISRSSQDNTVRHAENRSDVAPGGTKQPPAFVFVLLGVFVGAAIPFIARKASSAPSRLMYDSIN